MDEHSHDELVTQVRTWFTSRSGDPMTVTVMADDESRVIAAGPFLRMEEHPSSKGNYRALFDDSLTGGAGATRFFAFGYELQDVEVAENHLMLDKGSQCIEIVDHARSEGRPNADELVWPDPDPTETPTPPHTQHQASPLPVPAPPTVAATMTPQAPAPPPRPSAPIGAPAPPGAETSVAPDFLSVTMKAPMYGNSGLLGSGFYGDVNVQVQQGSMTVSGPLSSGGSNMLVGGALSIVLSVIGLALGVAISTDATSEHLGAVLGMASLVGLAAGLALHFFGRARTKATGRNATVQFPLSSARGLRARYDTNSGCLWMILLTPVIGLVIMLVMGRRTFRISAPLGPNGGRRTLLLKARNDVDAAMLNQALR